MADEWSDTRLIEDAFCGCETTECRGDRHRDQLRRGDERRLTALSQTCRALTASEASGCSS